MKDQLISFKTAKLAKKRGFNTETEKSHCIITSRIDLNPRETLRDTNKRFEPAPIKILESYYAPTQSLLHKWVREKHDILICVYSNASGFLWEHMKSVSGTHIGWSDVSGPNDGGCWDTYEEALEAGLKEALESIKIKNTM